MLFIIGSMYRRKMAKAYREEREMETKNGVESMTFDNFECSELSERIWT